MYWNHRLIKKYDKTTGEEMIGIVEAHYDDDDSVMCYTEDFMPISGQSLGDVTWVYKSMQEAFDKPMLDQRELEAFWKTRKSSLDKAIEEVHSGEAKTIPFEEIHKEWTEDCPYCGHKFPWGETTEGSIPSEHYETTGVDEEGYKVEIPKIQMIKHPYYKCPACGKHWLNCVQIEELRNKLNLDIDETNKRCLEE